MKRGFVVKKEGEGREKKKKKKEEAEELNPRSLSAKSCLESLWKTLSRAR